VAREYPGVAPAGRWWNSRAFRPAVATLADVQQGMQTGVLFVDARPHDQYVGEAGSQMRLGHLPGAVNHWWQDDLETAGFGRVFRSADSLRARYTAEGIVPDRDIILYCNSATEASHVFFVLKYLLGYPRVRIYAGSWTEWAGRSELPIERGSGPRYHPPLRVQ
jgi:thiosulfate/3-mercaptopyruvate sulfurtransferase